MAAGPPGTSLPERGSLREQPTSSVPKDAPGGRSAKEDESSALARMRDRVKEVEQLLKAVQGTSAVWKSKAEMFRWRLLMKLLLGRLRISFGSS